MKIAFVYDRINKWGGAERVLTALHEIWPDAPLLTSVYSLKNASWASCFKSIHPTFIQKIPFAKDKHEIFPYLMPMAFESLDLGGYDVVITTTSESAKGVIVKPNQLHLCYCLTPTRYLWSGYDEYFDTLPRRLLGILPLRYLKKWDKIAGQRPDEYIAISKAVQSRIKNYYHRDSKVIYPPVETNKFEIRNAKPETNTKYFLVVSRLVKYKKVDLVIEAFNKLGWDLKIVGAGSEEKKLKKMAKNNIEFLGKLTDDQLLFYYQNCQALIFPQEEDFGITAAEAQACGKPVIAFRGGGAQETVVEGVTGEFFYPQTVGVIVSKLQGFKVAEYKEQNCRKQAEKFAKERFKAEFKNFVEEKWKKHIKIIYTL